MSKDITVDEILQHESVEDVQKDIERAFKAVRNQLRDEQRIKLDAMERQS